MVTRRRTFGLPRREPGGRPERQAKPRPNERVARFPFVDELSGYNAKEETMTTQDKLIRRKMSLLELAEFLGNISNACRLMAVIH
jgi:hypothetical protein